MTKPLYTSTQKAKIKEFRHNISVLKRKGLVSKAIDARSIKPSSHYNSVIKNFKPVLEGTATAVKLPKKLREQYKSVGYKSAFEKIIIPHGPNERVIVTHGMPKTTNSSGIVKMDIPVKFINLEQYLRDLKAKNLKKKEDERWGFRFYGFNSRRTYDDFDDMIETLQHYESVLHAIEEKSIEESLEIIEGLTWYKIGNRKLWKAHGEKMQSENNKRKQAERRKKYLEHMSNSPTQQYLRYLERNKEHSRKIYNNMTEIQKEKRKKQMLEYTRKMKAKKNGK